MPEDLQAALTLEQFADLIAYLESLRRLPTSVESDREQLEQNPPDAT